MCGSRSVPLIWAQGASVLQVKVEKTGLIPSSQQGQLSKYLKFVHTQDTVDMARKQEKVYALKSFIEKASELGPELSHSLSISHVKEQSPLSKYCKDFISPPQNYKISVSLSIY